MIKIIENYSSPSYWYRKYSNGWIEQGGIEYRTFSTDELWTLTFPKPFTAPPLHVVGTFIAPRNSDSYGGEVGVQSDSVTATAVIFINDNYGTNKTGWMWEAKGY